MILNIKNFFLNICTVVLLSTGNDMKEKDVIEGDLTFRSISFASAYGASDKQYAELLQYMDSVLKGSKDGAVDAELMRYFSELKRHGLLRNPYIYLQVEPDSMTVIYLSEKEYDKVKGFRHVDLYQEGKKVILKLEIEGIEDGIYYSDNIIDVKKVNGRSRSNLNIDMD